MAQPSAPTPPMQATTGAARRARERKQRCTASRVEWLTTLFQSTAAHHTRSSGGSGSFPASCSSCHALRQRVEALERLMQSDSHPAHASHVLPHPVASSGRPVVGEVAVHEFEHVFKQEAVDAAVKVEGDAAVAVNTIQQEAEKVDDLVVKQEQVEKQIEQPTAWPTAPPSISPTTGHLIAMAESGQATVFQLTTNRAEGAASSTPGRQTSSCSRCRRPTAPSEKHGGCYCYTCWQGVMGADSDGASSACSS